MPPVPPAPDAGPQGLDQGAGVPAAGAPIAGTGPTPYQNPQSLQAIVPGQGYPIPYTADGFSAAGLVPLSYLGYDLAPLPPPFSLPGLVGSAVYGAGAYGQGAPPPTFPGGNWPGNIADFVNQVAQDVGGFLGGGNR